MYLSYFSMQSLPQLRHFSYACVKEVWSMWAQSRFDIFHQLLIIAKVLWPQADRQVGKQVAATWSEIRAVKRVVKQLPAEMLQHCSSTSCYISMHIIMEHDYTGVSIPHLFYWMDLCNFLLFCMEYTSHIIVVFCCMNSTITTLFLSQKQLPSAFWQTFV
jgi:hypothetical protein